jgi:hypothetical protein
MNPDDAECAATYRVGLVKTQVNMILADVMPEEPEIDINFDHKDAKSGKVIVAYSGRSKSYSVFEDSNMVMQQAQADIRAGYFGPKLFAALRSNERAKMT